jgi:hypothetical protein
MQPTLGPSHASGAMRDFFKPLTRRPSARKIAAFDCEGVGGEYGFTCGAVVSEAGKFSFTDRAAMLDYLTSADLRGHWIYAHNLEYDMGVLTAGDLARFSCLFAGTRLLWAETRDAHGHKWRLLDSGNLFVGQSVADLGAMVGLAKQFLRPDLESYVRAGAPIWELCQADRVQILDYNLRDAEIVYQAVLTLQDELMSLGGQLQATAAGVSMDLFRRAYMDYPWPAVHPALNDLGRMAFYGARCEPYRLGHVEGVNGYDISSAYPAVQAELDFPHPSHLVMDSSADGRSARLEHEGVSFCDVRVPSMAVPPLPMHCGLHLFFPTGRMSGAWTHNELRHAVSAGVVIDKIHWSLWSPISFSPFHDFMESLYARRMLHASSGDARAAVCKLLMTSSYGRFGMNPAEGLSVLQPLVPPVDWQKFAGADLRLVQGWPYALVPLDDRPQPAYVNTLIAATVTAGVRVKMHSYLEKYARELVYTDTDSLFLDGRMDTSHGLGAWRQTMTERDMLVVAPKEYAVFSGESLLRAHAKGVPDSEAAYYLLFGRAAFRSPMGIKEAVYRDGIISEWVKRVRERKGAWPKRPPAYPQAHALDYLETRPWDYAEIATLVRSGRPQPQPAALGLVQGLPESQLWDALVKQVQAARGHEAP